MRLAEHLDFDPRHTGADHAQYLSGAGREIEHTARHEGTAIEYLDGHLFAVAEVGDPDERTEGQSPVGGEQTVLP